MVKSENRKAKSVLITGASGFIGSHLVEAGLSRGFEVFAAIRKTSSRTFLTDTRIRILELDYSSPEILKKQLTAFKSEGIRFDFVIHNAGTTRARTPCEFDLVNHLYTRNLAEALEGTGQIPDKFIFISSLAAIGPGDPDTMAPLSDESFPCPVDSYGRSKRAAEQYLQSKTGFPFLIFRPTGVYGPREKDYLAVYRNLNNGFEFYAGSRLQRVSFLYITDLVNLIYEAAKSDFVNKTWVVSDGSNYSASDFSVLVKRILEKKALPVILPLPVVWLLAGILEVAYHPFGKVPLLNREKVVILGSRNWQCDPSVLFRDLQFSPQFDLERGLRETISWNREQGLIKKKKEGILV